MSRKLTLMRLSELREYLKPMRRKIAKLKVDSRQWRRCRIIIEQIEREINFKELILSGLRRVERGK